MTNSVRIVFLLDRTGSMRLEPRYSNTIAGFNAWLKETQDELPESNFSLIMFSSFGTEIVHRNARLGSVPELTPTQYQCDGLTPLFEAVCKAIEATERVASPDERVVITIVTDGMENCSPHPFTRTYVAEMVKKKMDAGWQFVFLGANMDAWDACEGTNIPRQSTMSYNTDDQAATLSAYMATARATREFGVTGQCVSFSEEDLAMADGNKFVKQPVPGGSGAATGQPVQDAGVNTHDIPEANEEWFKKAKLVNPQPSGFVKIEL